MKTMMLLMSLILSGCNIPNHQIQESNSESTRLNPIEEWVQSSLERGVFYKIDLKSNKVWMETRIWNLENGAAKKKCIILLSQYFNSKNGTKLVMILDKHSNKKLGEYAEFGKIEIYKRKEGAK